MHATYLLGRSLGSLEGPKLTVRVLWVQLVKPCYDPEDQKSWKSVLLGSVNVLHSSASALESASASIQ